MAVIGGFQSDLSISLVTDGNFGTFPPVFCFPKSRINENGGKTADRYYFTFIAILEKQHSNHSTMVILHYCMLN